MLDLRDEAIAAWLAEQGSEDIARRSREPGVKPDALLSDALAAFGKAHDAAIKRGPEALAEALTSDLAPSYAELLAYLGPDRSLRLLHWLTEAGFSDQHRVISAITDSRTPSGAVLLRRVTALLRRELLDRLFSSERLETLHNACRTVAEQEPTT